MAQSKRSTVYSFQNVAVEINGRPVEGLWEGDDAIQIEDFVAVGTPMVGADGASINSIAASTAVRLRIRLQATSPAHQLLDRLYKRFRTGEHFEFPVSVRDTGTGEGGNSSQVSFEGRGAANLGAKATVREWTLFAQCWERNPITYFG